MDDQRRHDGADGYGDDSAGFDEYSDYTGYDVDQEFLNGELYPPEAFDDPYEEYGNTVDYSESDRFPPGSSEEHQDTEDAGTDGDREPGRYPAWDKPSPAEEAETEIPSFEAVSELSTADNNKKTKKKKKKVRKKRRKKHDPDKRRRRIDRRIKRRMILKKVRKAFLIFLGIAAFLGVCFYLFFSSSVFLVSEIAVNHNTLKSDKQIISESGLRIGSNIFKFKSNDVKEAILKNNPYIFDVKVSRKLPNRVIITVDEHTPVAAVRYKGQYLILDAGGKVVGIEETQITATRLTGIVVTQYKKGSVPIVNNSTMLKNSLKLIRKVNDSGLFFKKLDVSSSFTVHGYITDDLECAGEPDDIIENLEGIKAIVYDLSQKNIMKGTIFVGKEGYATFSPTSASNSGSDSSDKTDDSGSRSSSGSSDSSQSKTKES